MKTSALLLSVMIFAGTLSGSRAADETFAPILEKESAEIAEVEQPETLSFFLPRNRLPAAVRDRLWVKRFAQLPARATDLSLAGPMFSAPARIMNAIVKASAVTGADFEYLLKTAALESSFDQSTEAKTSSAVGLFQFIDQTWLFMIREVGAEIGLGNFAAAVAVTRKGDYDIADAKLEAEALRLRYDPEVSAIMAGAFARRNADFVSRQLGRQPTGGELYIAHFLGASGGVDLIRLVEKEPSSLAKKYFAGAARANRSIFYDGRRPRTVTEVRDRLLTKYRQIPIYANSQAIASLY
jgi:hypothetical protein